VTEPSIDLAYARTDRGRIHYAQCGEGPPVLLLHQTPRSWDEYRELLPLLGRHLRAIAMDTPGMGASDPVIGEVSIEAFAEAAFALCDHLDIERPHVMGHHTGGVIALEMAAARPERVDHLVLSSTPWIDAAARERRQSRPPIDAVDFHPDGEHLGELWRRRQAFYPEDRSDLLRRFVRDALAVSDPEAGHEAVGRYQMEERAARVIAPTLCIGHDADPFAFPDLEPLAQRLRDVRTAVLAGGMVPLEYRADEIGELVVEFLCQGSG
jgi:pimeloyl-ACP methyl ester carboxylesterase